MNSSVLTIARWPILRIGGPQPKPSSPLSKTNAVTPRWPLPGSTVANTTHVSAAPPFEIQLFCPLIT